MNRSKRWVIGLLFMLVGTVMAESKKKKPAAKKEDTVIQKATAPVCKVSITDPIDGSEVPHNDKLWTHFTFTVKGIVENLGDKKLCLYQKKSLSDRVWWRSGDPITKDSLANGSSFQIDYATCGGRLNRHKECYVFAVVQDDCPPSGSTVSAIQNTFCESQKVSAKPKGIFK